MSCIKIKSDANSSWSQELELFHMPYFYQYKMKAIRLAEVASIHGIFLFKTTFDKKNCEG